MAQTAAQSSLVANGAVGDVGRNIGHESLGDVWNHFVFNLCMGCQGPQKQLGLLKAMGFESGDALKAHQLIGLCQSQIEHGAHGLTATQKFTVVGVLRLELQCV